MATIKIDLESRALFITGEITQEIVGEIAEKLFFLENQPSKAAIHVFINTCGGDLYSSIAIYDLLKSSTRTIKTIATGAVCSGGILVLGATKLKRRFITRNATLMIHNMSEEFPAMDQTAIKVNVNESERINNVYINILNGILGCDVTPLLKKRVDCYYSAKDAIEYSIVGGYWRPSKSY